MVDGIELCATAWLGVHLKGLQLGVDLPERVL
jgi:hypothetical protein